MANLKIVKETEKRWNDYYEHDDVYIYSRVLNVDTNKYVVDEEDFLNYGTGVISAVNQENCIDEGINIIEINGESKAIVKWEKPIYESNGELVGFCGENGKLEEILKSVRKVSVYNTNGKLLFETIRSNEDGYMYNDFKIKFKENVIYCIEMNTIFGNTKHTIYKNAYSYDGKVLFSKEETITNQDILDKVNTDDNELSM